MFPVLVLFFTVVWCFHLAGLFEVSERINEQAHTRKLQYENIKLVLLNNSISKYRQMKNVVQFNIHSHKMMKWIDETVDCVTYAFLVFRYIYRAHHNPCMVVYGVWLLVQPSHPGSTSNNSNDSNQVFTENTNEMPKILKNIWVWHLVPHHVRFMVTIVCMFASMRWREIEAFSHFGVWEIVVAMHNATQKRWFSVWLMNLNQKSFFIYAGEAAAAMLPVKCYDTLFFDC